MVISNNNSAPLETDLVGNLEDFGVSKYEARAYITLLEKGILGASEIAYYSNLPRTKIYTTLKKLEKKGLSIIIERKPLAASAVSPNEAFIEIISLHEKRLKNMKKIVQVLKKIEGGKRICGIEEKKYIVLDPMFVEQKVYELIQYSKSSITAMADPWGLRVLLRCKEVLESAISRGVSIRLLIGSHCLDNSNVQSLPTGLEIRLHQFSDSVIMIDSSKIISIDSTNGKAAIVRSVDTIGDGYIRLFEERWTQALKVRSLADFDHEMLLRALLLKKKAEDKLSEQILEHITGPKRDQQFPMCSSTICEE
jgi:sugar-specific transcriptional regulator TrmB